MRNAVALAGAILVACGASAPPPPSPAVTPAVGGAQSAQTTAPATPSAALPAARTSPAQTATATRNPARAEVTLRWDAGALISDVDDVFAIVTRLKNTPGILDGFGDESSITVVYDPQQMNVDKIRRLLLDMGFPTKSP